MRSRSAPVNSRTVTWYVSVPRSALPSPAAVRLRYQSGVGGCSCLGGEDVDDVRLGVVREVHHRGDVLPPACAAAVMHQDQRGALEVPADPALVRPELRDGLRVPVERVALSNSSRSRSRGMRWDRVMEGPAAVLGDYASDLVLPGSGG